MRWIWRVLLVLAVFGVLGYTATHVLIAHAVAKGTPEYSVRLGAAVGGLFLGGAGAGLVALALLVGGRPASSGHEERD